jgi:hypothetical protein
MPRHSGEDDFSPEEAQKHSEIERRYERKRLDEIERHQREMRELDRRFDEEWRVVISEMRRRKVEPGVMWFDISDKQWKRKD